MSDHYVKAKVQLEQMKSLGENAEKEGEHPEQQMPVSPPPGSLSPDPSSITIADTSSDCKQGLNGGKNSNKPVSDDKKHIPDNVGKNLNRLGHEQTPHFKGAGRILQGKLETNGNYVTIHPSKNTQDSRREDKLTRKRRPVAVDSSKAKTSLEALKLSIKQLKWKEVCSLRVLLFVFHWYQTLESCFHYVAQCLNEQS